MNTNAQHEGRTKEHQRLHMLWATGRATKKQIFRCMELDQKGPGLSANYAVLVLERDALRETVRELVAALDKIVSADASGNNGAVVGEAKICPYFEVMATEALANARKVLL